MWEFLCNFAAFFETNNCYMKAKSIISFALICLATFLFSCKETPYIPSPGDNSHNQDSIQIVPDAKPDPDPEGIEIPENAINVLEACSICNGLASGAATTEEYFIKGWITGLGSKNADGINNYGNATFYMSANRTGSNKQFYAYQVMGKDGKRITHLDQVRIGDFVVIKGKMTNYNGTFETQGQGAAHIYSSTNPLFDPSNVEPSPDPAGADIPEGTLNVIEACKLGGELASGAKTPDKYYVKGWVVRLDSKHAEGMSKYGNGTFYIAPTKEGIGDQFEAYQVYGKGGKKFTAEQTNAVAVGDFVVIYGQITNYKGTVETVGQGASYVYYSTNPDWAK